MNITTKTKKSQEKEKYILFTLEYPPFKGGVANYYGNLVKHWNGEIFVLADGKKEKNDASNIIRRPLVVNWLYPRWLPAMFHLWQTIFKFRISSSRFHIIVGHVLPLGAVCYFLSKIISFKYSVILHGMDFAYALSLPRKKKITGKILKKANKIICANSHTAGLVKNFNPDLTDKISVINPGVNTHIVRNPKKVEELKKKYNLGQKTIILSIGRLVKRKGFDKTIEALGVVLENDKNIRYLIAGEGEEEKNLKSLAEKIPNGRERIIFLGKITEEEKSAWLEACDIFIMPSRRIKNDFEGFGIVYLEANLFGKPVIAGESGGVADAVINNVTGLTVDPENPKKIAEAIVNLSQDAKLRQELGGAGQRRAVVNFDSKKQVEKIKNAISASV